RRQFWTVHRSGKNDTGPTRVLPYEHDNFTMPGCCNQRLFDRFGAHRFNHEVDPLTARELTNSGTPLRICYVVDDLICTELPQFLRLFDAGGGRDDTTAPSVLRIGQRTATRPRFQA